MAPLFVPQRTQQSGVLWDALAIHAGQRKIQDDSPFDSPKRSQSLRRVGHGNRVLMFGRIRELALYRAEVLRDRGFEVVTPKDRAQAMDAIRAGGFDVAVLTYTLSNETVQELAAMVREYCPNCPLVAISHEKRIDRKIGPDAMVKADDGPAALIATLRRLTRQV